MGPRDRAPGGDRRRASVAASPRARGLAALAAALAGASLAREAFTGLSPRGAATAGARAARVARAAERARAAHIAVVDCSVKAGDEEAFIEATLETCRKSIFEEWCQRYDFLQSTEDPTQFALLEVYRKPIGPVDHLSTQHHMAWADAVRPMMASDRSSTQWDTICPTLASGYIPNALVLESSMPRVFDVTYVYVDVRPGSEDAFIEATRENVEQSLMEPDNLRFDFLRNVDEPNRFMLIEVYRKAESAAEHKETDHYLTWRETVANMMASPRVGKKYKNVFPNLPAGWQAPDPRLR